MNSVNVDNRKGARVSMRHLASRGHRRIGMLSGSPALLTDGVRLESEPPTAIFAASSMMGFEALKATHELGLR